MLLLNWAWACAYSWTMERCQPGSGSSSSRTPGILLHGSGSSSSRTPGILLHGSGSSSSRTPGILLRGSSSSSSRTPGILLRGGVTQACLGILILIPTLLLIIIITKRRSGIGPCRGPWLSGIGPWLSAEDRDYNTSKCHKCASRACQQYASRAK